MEGKILPQEVQYVILGLSRAAVKNIVILFILVLIGAIAALSWVVVFQNKEIKQLNQDVLEAQQNGATKYQELQSENLRTFIRLNELLMNQQQIKQDLRDTKETLQDVQEKIVK